MTNQNERLKQVQLIANIKKKPFRILKGFDIIITLDLHSQGDI